MLLDILLKEKGPAGPFSFYSIDVYFNYVTPKSRQQVISYLPKIPRMHRQQ